MERDVLTLGQVFTPDSVVERMLALRRGTGRVLEPSCGDGAFWKKLPQDQRVGIEFDASVAPPGAQVQDFFAYPTTEQFETIIGNPPFVRFQDIHPQTKALLPQGFDRRTNLYVFFLWKCLDHLAPGGELIFINPRDFLQATHAAPLNRRLMQEGTITHLDDLGDAPVFQGYAPNCVIWRFEKSLLTHQTDDGRHAVLTGGQIVFERDAQNRVPLGSLCRIRVGAVSGMDQVFEHPDGQPFVHSKTLDTGHTRRMLYPGHQPHADLLPHKAALLARRGAKFREDNWWGWIRGIAPIPSGAARVYVPMKTRRPRPFFAHPSEHFEGSVMAVYALQAQIPSAQMADALNALDWQAQGFKSGGRFLFGQRSLSAALVPHDLFG